MVGKETGGVVEEEANAHGAQAACDAMPAHPNSPLLHRFAA